jgi:hypothetical protein
MKILSADYSEDVANFYYAASGTPAGLALDSTTGKLTGQIDPAVVEGTIYSVTISAFNSAGEAINPQLLKIKVIMTGPPVISFA